MTGRMPISDNPGLASARSENPDRAWRSAAGSDGALANRGNAATAVGIEQGRALDGAAGGLAPQARRRERVSGRALASENTPGP